MRWTIQQLLANQRTGVTIDDSIDGQDLVETDKELRAISPIKVTGNGEISSERAEFTLNIKGVMTLPCSRTLADVEVPFDIQAVERFQLDGKPVSEEDDSLHEPEQGIINLSPYIKEHVLLELPIQVIGDSADGEAPQQGEFWEVVTEDELKHRREQEQDQKVDPRLADLAKFFEKED
ncbi:YceD family protein [Salsuginibacillus kocurii]|uniref:YceD family protein n=1 Tax=Salsuginibacillus kocurii TaxID=427078 RepID=UPI00036E234E|nr:YceD family protein [Salsuginibacillus kocurii]